MEKEEDIMKQMQVEASMTMGLLHPNIIRMYGTATFEGRMALVMEMAEQGPLTHTMAKLLSPLLLLVILNKTNKQTKRKKKTAITPYLLLFLFLNLFLFSFSFSFTLLLALSFSSSSFSFSPNATPSLLLEPKQPKH